MDGIVDDDHEPGREPHGDILVVSGHITFCPGFPFFGRSKVLAGEDHIFHESVAVDYGVSSDDDCGRGKRWLEDDQKGDEVGGDMNERRKPALGLVVRHPG